MAVATKTTGIIAKKQAEKSVKETKKPTSLKDWLETADFKAQVAKALPAVITPERFTRMLLTAVRNNPKLAKCEVSSFFASALTAAQLGLEPNSPLGQAYLIPYGNRCEFQLGYKGLIDLAYRSGEVTIVQANTVYEKDEFIYELGLEAKLIHKPCMKGDRGEAIAYYAIFKLKNGGENFAVMSKDDVISFAKEKSKTFGSGAWQTDFDAMAKKTVLKQALKYAPIRTEAMEKAQALDGRADLVVDQETGEVMSNGVEIFEDDPITDEDIQAMEEEVAE